jgi:hypothetical protein
VKPYVRRNKSDQVDAAAIYEAMVAGRCSSGTARIHRRRRNFS